MPPFDVSWSAPLRALAICWATPAARMAASVSGLILGMRPYLRPTLRSHQPQSLPPSDSTSVFSLISQVLLAKLCVDTLHEILAIRKKSGSLSANTGSTEWQPITVANLRAGAAAQALHRPPVF